MFVANSCCVTFYFFAKYWEKTVLLLLPHLCIYKIIPSSTNAFVFFPPFMGQWRSLRLDPPVSDRCSNGRKWLPHFPTANHIIFHLLYVCVPIKATPGLQIWAMVNYLENTCVQGVSTITVAHNKDNYKRECKLIRNS